MNLANTFEDEWGSLRKLHENDSFEYYNQDKFKKVARDSLKKYVKNPETKYGVYIIRKMDDNEVIYIGKGGSIKKNGNFKEQNILERLINIRKGMNANDWFYHLFKKYKSVKIEYIFLPRSKSPTLVEAILLQAFLNEFDKLPDENESF